MASRRACASGYEADPRNGLAVCFTSHPVGWWTDYALDFFMSWPMRRRADICRQKAKECERAAMRVADPQVQFTYRQMSRQVA